MTYTFHIGTIVHFNADSGKIKMLLPIRFHSKRFGGQSPSEHMRRLT